MPSPFEFSPLKLVYGGEALGFHDGRTVLAPLVLPGERVEAEEVRRQKGVIHARPLRIIEPSPQRVAPPCPYFGRCGGCQYQHFPHAAQMAAKVEILRETLRRLGQVKWDGPIPVHAGPAWNYRNQAQLKVGRAADGAAALGFFAAESNRLVSIDACPILSPRLNMLLGVLRSESWAAALSKCREIELMADDCDEKVMLTLAGNWPAGEAKTLAARCLAELAGVSTVAVARPAGLQVLGAPHLTYRVGEFSYRVSPTSFFQSARFLLPEFVAAAAALNGQQTSGRLAIDLFAGVGLFTLPLATRFERVIAVEAHPPAAADLTANARAANAQAANARAAAVGNIGAVEATAFDFLRRYAQTGPDLVVLDPPRAGVGVEPLKLLAALRPQRLHYLSCSPPTLARDLSCLLRQGYRLESLELFDFFPQTFHIECLARLVRSAT